jgi:four helix bundle protein
MKYKSFEEFPIWTQCIVFAKEIYQITNKGEFRRDFGLKDQIRRAAVSMSSNIAEGFERNNPKEFVRYLIIAKGSAGEVRSQLILAHSIQYITDEEGHHLSSKIKNIIASLGGLISYLKHSPYSQSANPKIRKSANY